MRDKSQKEALFGGERLEKGRGEHAIDRTGRRSRQKEEEEEKEKRGRGRRELKEEKVGKESEGV